MNVFVRYVLFGVIKNFIAVLFLCTLTFLFVVIIQTTIKNGAPFFLTLRLAPYFIPYTFSVALPISALFAVTVFFSRMGGNNELIALKAMGIAPWKILAPVWLFMVLVSISGIWFNDLSTSWTRMQVKRALLNGFESILLSKLKTDGHFITLDGNYEIKVSEVLEDGTLLNPEFSLKVDGVNGTGDSAQISVDYNPDNPLVNIHLYKAEIQGEHVEFYIPINYEFSIPLSAAFKENSRVDPPAKEIKQALINLASEKKRFHKSLASKAMFSFLTGSLTGTVTPEWKQRMETEWYYNRQKRRFRLTIPRICAAGFSSFFFAWVGAPYALKSKKADMMYAFLCSFLPIAGIYYAFFSLGLETAKNGILPSYAVWMGNIVLGFIGIHYLKQIH